VNSFLVANGDTHTNDATPVLNSDVSCYPDVFCLERGRAFFGNLV